MIRQNIKLLNAIRARGLRQKDISKILKVSESTVSEVVTGRRVADEPLQSKIAKFLNMPVGELFPMAEPTEHHGGGELQACYECRSERYSK